jgi:hypothetical protein
VSYRRQQLSANYWNARLAFIGERLNDSEIKGMSVANNSVYGKYMGYLVICSYTLIKELKRFYCYFQIFRNLELPSCTCMKFIIELHLRKVFTVFAKSQNSCQITKYII